MFAQLEALKGVLDYIPIQIWKTHQPVVVPPKSLMSWAVRCAGVSGALAVGLGAYGSHVVLRSTEVPKERKRSFKTASKYHLIHTLALLASKQGRYPHITASILLCGTVMFCGPCYHFALTGSDKVKFLTPYGGILLILGWLSFVL